MPSEAMRRFSRLIRDRRPPTLQPLAERRRQMEEAQARLSLPDLPGEGTYHTLAGLLLALLRRVPRQGDRIVYGGWRFEVLAMDGRRVDKVIAGREPAAEA